MRDFRARRCRKIPEWCSICHDLSLARAMGATQSSSSRSTPRVPNDTKPMDTKYSRPIPKIAFRVLIIGRANAGKTTILQRVCDTTDSPTIYRQNNGRREEVRHGSLAELPILSYTTQIKIEPSTLVSDKRDCQLSPFNPKSAWRARHQPRTCVL